MHDARQHEEKLNPREARQGRLGRPVLMVLVAGLALVVLAFGGILLGYI